MSKPRKTKRNNKKKTEHEYINISIKEKDIDRGENIESNDSHSGSFSEKHQIGNVNITNDYELHNIQPLAVVKQSNGSTYRVKDLSTVSTINVPVKSARTPYLGVLKKEMTIKKTCTEIKEDEYIEMAKKKERIVLEEQFNVPYKEIQKEKSGSLMMKLKKFFCCL